MRMPVLEQRAGRVQRCRPSAGGRAGSESPSPGRECGGRGARQGAACCGEQPQSESTAPPLSLRGCAGRATAPGGSAGGAWGEELGGSCNSVCGRRERPRRTSCLAASAAPRLHLVCTSAPPRQLGAASGLHLGSTSAPPRGCVSRLHLGAASRLNIGYISAPPRLHLVAASRLHLAAQVRDRKR